MKMTVEIDGKKYQVTIENIHNRPVTADVEGQRFQVWPGEVLSTPGVPAETTSLKPLDTHMEAEPKLKMDHTGGGKALTAPLPGVILAIQVKPGEQVSRGQDVCILEAMKMKNAIKSHRDGTIASVEVNVGDQVGHGQVLVTFQD